MFRIFHSFLDPSISGLWCIIHRILVGFYFLFFLKKNYSLTKRFDFLLFRRIFFRFLVFCHYEHFSLTIVSIERILENLGHVEISVNFY